MINYRRPNLLRNKSNKSMIVLFQKVMLIKDIPNTAENHRFNKGPIFLIKKASKPIRPRAFVAPILNTES
jgi:hypothetical protein